jgi:hypothetical protein
LAPRIFVSYRRGETSAHAGRIADRLVARFGDENVFMDVDTIAPGADFVEQIQDAVGSCDALVAVIGRDWLSARDSAGRRRVDDPADFVRLEVGAALERKVLVVPVLVEGVAMPLADELPGPLAPLSRRNALEVNDTRFRQDADRLIDAIAAIPLANEPRRGVGGASVVDPGGRWAPARRPVGVAVGALAIAAAVVAVVLQQDGSKHAKAPSAERRATVVPSPAETPSQDDPNGGASPPEPAKPAEIGSWHGSAEQVRPSGQRDSVAVEASINDGQVGANVGSWQERIPGTTSNCGGRLRLLDRGDRTMSLAYKETLDPQKCTARTRISTALRDDGLHFTERYATTEGSGTVSGTLRRAK